MQNNKKRSIQETEDNTSSNKVERVIGLAGYDGGRHCFTLYNGEMVNGKKHGRGTMIYNNGTPKVHDDCKDYATYIGEWKDDQKHGTDQLCSWKLTLQEQVSWIGK